jgi:hypothetical protein
LKTQIRDPGPERLFFNVKLALNGVYLMVKNAEQMNCPSCSRIIMLAGLCQDEFICECGYLVLPFEFSANPLRIVKTDDGNISKCS